MKAANWNNLFMHQPSQSQPHFGSLNIHDFEPEKQQTRVFVILYEIQHVETGGSTSRKYTRYRFDHAECMPFLNRGF